MLYFYYLHIIKIVAIFFGENCNLKSENERIIKETPSKCAAAGVSTPKATTKKTIKALKTPVKGIYFEKKCKIYPLNLLFFAYHRYITAKALRYYSRKFS